MPPKPRMHLGPATPATRLWKSYLSLSIRQYPIGFVIAVSGHAGCLPSSGGGSAAAKRFTEAADDLHSGPAVACGDLALKLAAVIAAV